MGRALGIIGGGQLGMMLTEAAMRMPGEVSKVIVLDPTEGCPAAQKGAEQIVAGFRQEDAIVELAERSDIITYEIESGDSGILESVQDRARVSPSPGTLRIIQDKFLQKSFLAENGLPVPEFARIESLDGLKAGLGRFGTPSLLKARRDAYDGRGNFKILSPGGAGEAYDRLGGRGLMLERLVPFKMEVSVIAARGTGGEIRTFPLVENVHEENILRQTIAPARVTGAVAAKAERIAEDTMGLLKGAGVFGIEMFVTGGDEILINEIAPRVHNSGHHTLQSSETSQFEQHLRAILGMELGSTRLNRPTVMCNILGPEGFEGEYEGPVLDEPGVFLKMYGKRVSKPLRKLGHYNIVGRDGQTVGQLLERASALSGRSVPRPGT